MGTPHKHADLIKAWADGAEIEYQDFNGNWRATTNRTPSWIPDNKYRIKPKPLVKKYRFAFGTADGQSFISIDHYKDGEDFSQSNKTISSWTRLDWTMIEVVEE